MVKIRLKLFFNFCQFQRFMNRKWLNRSIFELQSSNLYHFEALAKIITSSRVKSLSLPRPGRKTQTRFFGVRYHQLFIFVRTQPVIRQQTKKKNGLFSNFKNFSNSQSSSRSSSRDSNKSSNQWQGKKLQVDVSLNLIFSCLRFLVSGPSGSIRPFEKKTQKEKIVKSETESETQVLSGLP